MEDTLFLISVLCFLGLIVVVLLSGLVHLGVLLWRRRRGQPLHPNWWIIVSSIAVFPGLLWIAALSSVDAAEFIMAYKYLGWIEVPAFVALLLVPTAGLIIRAYTESTFSIVGYVSSLAAIVALPGAMVVLSFFVLAFSSELFNGPSLTSMDEVLPSAYFTIDPESECTDEVERRLGLKSWATFERSIDEPDFFQDRSRMLLQFWVDNTLKAALLDGPETFGCNFGRIQHRQDVYVMDATVFIYRSFVSFIIVSVVLLPFARRALQEHEGHLI